MGLRVVSVSPEGAGARALTETLVLTGCEWLNDAGVRALAATAGRTLRTVDLSATADLSDTGVRALAALCPCLTQLSLIACHRLTDAGP